LKLGLSYDSGKGVPQDYSEAYVWLTLSAANGYKDAPKIRDRTANKLSHQALERAQARARTLHAEIQAKNGKK
jgi:TPR repeat protein